MQRRQFALAALPLAAVVVAPALLTGCGFALRGAPDFAFSTIDLGAAPRSALVSELARNIESSGKAKVVTAAAPVPGTSQAAGADVVFVLLSEKRERVVVGQTASGQVRELQLRLRISFQLRSRAGSELIAPTEIFQQREVSFNETVVLAKESEEALLYRDMQSDIVQQLLRRLAAIKI